MSSGCALELLACRCRLESARAIGIDDKVDVQIQRPVKLLLNRATIFAIGAGFRRNGGALFDVLHKRQVCDVEVLAVIELNILPNIRFHAAMRSLYKTFHAEVAYRANGDGGSN